MDKNVGVIHGTLQTRVVYHHILGMFSKGTRIKDSNEAEVLAILEALRISPLHFQDIIIVESNSSNAYFVGNSLESQTVEASVLF